MRFSCASPAPPFFDGLSIGKALPTSPSFTKILYRLFGSAVLLACVAVSLPAISAAQAREDTPQITPKDWKVTKKKEQGPRALGVLQVSSNGKATLVPITIRIDGKFYDATAYKASPVPMAIDTGTVYEGENTGTSAGLFTVNGAMRSVVANSPHPWIGTGMWLPTGTDAPKTGRKAEDVPVGIESADAPPRLSKGGSAPKGDAPKEATAAPQTSPDSPTGSNPTGGSQPKEEPQKPGSTGDAKPADKAAPSADRGSNSGDDTNRPRLRRGKPTEPLPDDDVPGYAKPGAAGAPGTKSAPTAKITSSLLTAVQLIPAISDAGGPDPRSYKFEWPKGEEEDRRKQMEALAREQILAYARNQAKGKAETAPAAPKGATRRSQIAKSPELELQNVQMRTFDLWNNNQPVLVLSAEAHLPPATGAAAPPDSTSKYTITLVARTDIYNNLHKLYAGVTDKYHLDVTPRLELIDAVDADGDGRGELLFQQTTDAGSGYVIYRATADKLWKLFDSLNPE
jgi:hypothetical protein